MDHADDNVFVINLYALHNATLLRKALAQHLTKSKPLYEDRSSHHNILAAALRVSQKDKRTKTQEKRKATLAVKKAQKRKREEAMDENELSDIGENDLADKRPRLDTQFLKSVSYTT